MSVKKNALCAFLGFFFFTVFGSKGLAVGSAVLGDRACILDSNGKIAVMEIGANPINAQPLPYSGTDDTYSIYRVEQESDGTIVVTGVDSVGRTNEIVLDAFNPEPTTALLETGKPEKSFCERKWWVCYLVGPVAGAAVSTVLGVVKYMHKKRLGCFKDEEAQSPTDTAPVGE